MISRLVKTKKAINIIFRLNKNIHLKPQRKNLNWSICLYCNMRDGFKDLQECMVDWYNNLE